MEQYAGKRKQVISLPFMTSLRVLPRIEVHDKEDVQDSDRPDSDNLRSVLDDSCLIHRRALVLLPVRTGVHSHSRVQNNQNCILRMNVIYRREHRSPITICP